jgi:hypothetical protein
MATTAGQRACLASVLVLGFLLVADLARANGYGEAKSLIDKAEQAFAAKDRATALRLLKQALKTQTVPDRKREEYGYAAYVHYRLGRFYWEHGQAKRARQEIERAIGITSSQQFVEASYLVSRTDPLVLDVLPFLKKQKVVPLDKGRMLPNTIALLPRGRRVFVMGDHSVGELDRSARTLTVLHEQPGDSLYRIDAKADGSALLLAYEGADHILYLKTDGSPPVRLRRPFLPEDLYFAPRGDAAILWADRRAVKLPIPAGRPATTLFSLETPATRLVLRGGIGNMVLRTANVGVSAGFFPDNDSEDSVDGTIRYVAHFLDSGKAVPLVERSFALGARDRVLRIYADDDRAFGLYFWNRETESNRLLTIDLDTRTLKTSDINLGVEPWDQDEYGHGDAGTIVFSARHDYVVALSSQGTRLRVVRFVPGAKAPKADHCYDLAATLSADAPSLNIKGAGVLADNTRLWIATATAIILVDPEGEARAAGLATLLGSKSFQWDARPYGFSSPDELYLPLAKGKGRFLARIGMDEIDRAAHKLPALARDAPSQALRISYRDCSTMRAGIEQAFDGTAAQMDDVRRAISGGKTKCAKEKNQLAFGLTRHLLTMPAKLGPREAKYLDDLFAAVRGVDGPDYLVFERAVTDGVDESKQQALALLNVARFVNWWGDTRQSPSLACTTGIMINELLAVLREDPNEWVVFWKAAKAAAPGCLSLPDDNRLRGAWCETVLDVSGFDAARFGKALQLDLKRECGR